jgi:hypothetical protein
MVRPIHCGPQRLGLTIVRHGGWGYPSWRLPKRRRGHPTVVAHEGGCIVLINFKTVV